MAVGLRRRGNPYGATGFFGYDDTQEQPGYMGFEQVAGVGDAPLPVQTEDQPQLITPIDQTQQPKNDDGFLSSIFGGGGDEMPSQASIDRRQKLAESLIAKGSETGEIRSPWEALGRVAQQWTGAYMQSKAEKDAEKVTKRRQDSLKGALGDGGDLGAMADRLLASDDPDLVDKGLEIKMQLATQGAKTARKPNPTRNYNSGGQEVTEEWDDQAQAWKPLATAPRYKTGGGGGGGDGDGFSPTAMGANFALPTGKIVSAPFQKGRGFIYRDDVTGEWKDIPAGARRMTESTGGGLSPGQYQKLKMERRQNINALSALEKYFKTVGGLPQGVQRWANSLTANAKTMFSGQLSADEFNQLDAGAQAQALLGMFRTTVVGPGVMTEYDAVRVLNALGKDPASALQNTQVIGPILQNLYERKRAELQEQEDTYRRNAPYYDETPNDIGVPDQIGGSEAAPAAPPQAAAPPKESRVKGQVYDTPRGKMIWTGTGWRPAQ